MCCIVMSRTFADYQMMTVVKAALMIQTLLLLWALMSHTKILIEIVDNTQQRENEKKFVLVSNFFSFLRRRELQTASAVKVNWKSLSSSRGLALSSPSLAFSFFRVVEKFPLPKAHVFKANIGTFFLMFVAFSLSPLLRMHDDMATEDMKKFSSQLENYSQDLCVCFLIPLHFSLSDSSLSSFPTFILLELVCVGDSRSNFEFSHSCSTLCSAINLIWKFQISCWSII